MFQNIGTTEIVIIALLIIVLFGGKKIPELMRGIGESIKEFRKASSEEIFFIASGIDENENGSQSKAASPAISKPPAIFLQMDILLHQQCTELDCQIAIHLRPNFFGTQQPVDFPAVLT